MEYELAVANDILFLAIKYSLSRSTDAAELVIDTIKASFPILRRFFIPGAGQIKRVVLLPVLS